MSEGCDGIISISGGLSDDAREIMHACIVQLAKRAEKKTGLCKIIMLNVLHNRLQHLFKLPGIVLHGDLFFDLDGFYGRGEFFFARLSL